MLRLALRNAVKRRVFAFEMRHSCDTGPSGDVRDEDRGARAKHETRETAQAAGGWLQAVRPEAMA